MHIHTDILYNILRFCTPADLCNITISYCFNNNRIMRYIDWLKKDNDCYLKFENSVAGLYTEILSQLLSRFNNGSHYIYDIYSAWSICSDDLHYDNSLRIRVFMDMILTIYIGRNNHTLIYDFIGRSKENPQNVNLYLAQGLELAQLNGDDNHYIVDSSGGHSQDAHDLYYEPSGEKPPTYSLYRISIVGSLQKFQPTNPWCKFDTYLKKIAPKTTTPKTTTKK